MRQVEQTPVMARRAPKVKRKKVRFWAAKSWEITNQFSRPFIPHVFRYGSPKNKNIRTILFSFFYNHSSQLEGSIFKSVLAVPLRSQKGNRHSERHNAGLRRFRPKQDHVVSTHIPCNLLGSKLYLYTGHQVRFYSGQVGVDCSWYPLANGGSRTD